MEYACVRDSVPKRGSSFEGVNCSNVLTIECARVSRVADEPQALT